MCRLPQGPSSWGPWAGLALLRGSQAPRRRLDSLEASQRAPRDPRRGSREERSPWLPLETRPDSPGEPGLPLGLWMGSKPRLWEELAWFNTRHPTPNLFPSSLSSLLGE